jgi:hypothetical protein
MAMKISKDMETSALVEVLGAGTVAEAEALRRSLVALHDGAELSDLPEFILSAHINHALAALPTDIPGEFFR